MLISHSDRNREWQQGYSLVEAMVASLILGLSIIGVVSMLRTVKELETDVHLTRKARIVAESILDSMSYKDYRRFASPIAAVSTTVLEDRGPNSIIANVRLDILLEETRPWQDRTFPYRQVRATVSWPDPVSATTVNLSLYKTIANLQP